VSVRRVTPDPYIVMDVATDGLKLRVFPHTREHLRIEFHRHDVKKMEVIVSLDDLKTLHEEGERLITDKLQQLQRDTTCMTLVVWSPPA
jgi:hypothetical protein